MGIVKRQSIKYSLVTFVGVAIGAVNMLLVYPLAFMTDHIGAFQLIIASAFVILPFISFGTSGVAIRFFSRFQNSTDNRGLLTLLLGVWVLGFLGFVGVYAIGGDSIVNSTLKGGRDLSVYIDLMLPILFFTGTSKILTSYISNYHRITFPAIFNNLLLKIAQPLLAIGYLVGLISFYAFLVGVGLAYALVSVLLFAYLHQIQPGGLSFDRVRISPVVQREMGSFVAYGVVGSISTILILKVDILMVGWLSTLSAAGIYSVVAIISEVLDTPRKAIESITNPIVSSHLKTDNMDELEQLYRSSSLHLILAGMGLFLLISLNIDYLFALMPDGERFVPGKWVVVVLMLGTLYDLFTSINSAIIIYSRYYRWNFYATISFAILVVVSNYFFIGWLGLIGAAWATVLAKVVFNTSKSIYVWMKFRIHFLSPKLGMTIGLGVLIYFAFLNIAFPLPPFWAICIQSLLIVLIYGGTVFALRISDDVNDSITAALKKIVGRA